MAASREVPATIDSGGTTHSRELSDAREQAVATEEILIALGRAGANSGEILDRIIQRAASLCGAEAAQLNLADEDVFRLSRLSTSVPEKFRRHFQDPTPAQVDGDPWKTPSHVYESLIRLGDRDGTPMFSLTSLQELRPAPPSADYLRTILRGLAEIWPSTPWMRSRYLAEAPGMAPTWSAATLDDLTRSAAPLA